MSPSSSLRIPLTSTTASRTKSPARRRALFVLVVVCVVLVVLDQLTKIWAVEALTGQGYIPLLGEYVGLVLVYNPGMAFGLATSATWLLALVTIVVIIAIARVSRSLTSMPWAIVLGMMLGGAVGNLIDRLARDPGFLRGHVVDFISYYTWFVGNIADIAIVGAALGIIVLTLLGVEMSEEQPGAKRGEDGGGE